MKKIVVAIDASSIVNTGGLTHLYELLNNFNKQEHPEIKKIIVISSEKVLKNLPNKNIFIKKTSFFLNSNKIFRIIYQTYLMDFYLKKRADVLLSITGDFIGKFKPVVGMSQNMLLYERIFWKEIKSFREKLKLQINFIRQKKCFLNSSGIIFISKYARDYILEQLPVKRIPNIIIHHGISKRFINRKNLNCKYGNYTITKPFKFIYVSTVHVYKNQVNTIKAVTNLRKCGFPVTLTLLGPIIYPPYGEKMILEINKSDPEKEFIKYIDEVPYKEIQKFYSSHDGIIFASTCENMPNILIESMASGLPIACSKKMPMPEFLEDGGVYFNANSTKSIEKALIYLINNLPLLEKRKNNLRKLKTLSWQITSKKTFRFISNIKTTILCLMEAYY